MYLSRRRLSLEFWIYRDDAYVYRENNITPVLPSLANNVQDSFIFFLFSFCIHVEQAFGTVVARWKILKEDLQFIILRNATVVCLCMKLHKFCWERRECSVRKLLSQEEQEEMELE